MSIQAQRRVVYLFLAILAASLSVHGAEIRLKATVFSRGSLVLLGDVAQIVGTSDEEVTQLKRLELFPAPSVGTVRALRRRELRELLVLNDIDAGRHQITGATMVRIGPKRTVARPPTPTVAKPQPKPIQPSHDLAPTAAVVAKRRLERGDVIREADVELKAQTGKRAQGKSLARSLEEVIDQELTRPLATGQPVDLQMLRRPVLVHRNENISVLARAAGVLVRTEARATEDGSHGDVIVVQSLGSRERYSARITGYRRAEVYASGVLVANPKAQTLRGTRGRPSSR